MEYTFNQASLKDIEDHLWRVDKDFKPPLHTYINIEEYAKKMAQQAMRFEFFDGKDLVGIMAAYFNEEKNFIFVTNFSLEQKYRGEGLRWVEELLQEIAYTEDETKVPQKEIREGVKNFTAQLFKYIRENYQNSKVYEIHTEVRNENHRLATLYRIMGFDLTEKSENAFYLVYKL